jgi:type I restriction-modification system DNA methylase subunit
MTSDSVTNSDLAYADTLWKAADALRGQVDAAEYKHVVLGLLFLKYISDSFEARREELRVELEADGIREPHIEPLLENRDEYTAERVFWVPPESRWTNLQNQAIRPEIATLIDDAILAVERDNPNLKGKLPRDYARRGIEPIKLKRGIPVCLWFLTRDKTGKNLKHGGRDRKGETLFIDARKLGTLQTRTLRVLSGGDDGETLLADGKGDPNPGSDIGRIIYAFRQWRGEPTPAWWDSQKHGAWTYRDIPGFCMSVNSAGIGKHGFVLTPGRYVGAEEQEQDAEPFTEKYPRLLAELETELAAGERLTAVVREQLGRVKHGG